MEFFISGSINIFKTSFEISSSNLNDIHEYILDNENSQILSFKYMNKKTGYYNTIQNDKIVKEKFTSYEPILLFYLKEEKILLINSNKVNSLKIKRKLESIFKESIKGIDINLLETFNKIKTKTDEITSFKLVINNFLTEISYFGNIEIIANTDKNVIEKFSSKLENLKKIEALTSYFGKVKLENPNSVWFSKDIDIFELNDLINKNE